MPTKTSIIIPVYNEEGSIEKVVAGLKVYLSQECEIIAVNDGSSDRSQEILKNISDIKVINHPANCGYGAALKSGIRASQGEYIIIIDADGSYPIESIKELLSQKEKYDMVVGARIKPQKQIPTLRKPAKWMLSQLANYLTKTKIPDLNSGLRIIKRSILDKFINLLPNGFSFTTTITLALLTNGYQVKYIPIDYHKRQGKSKIRPIRDTINFLQLIIRTVLHFSPLKIFIPLSLMVLTAALIVAIISLVSSVRFMDTTFVILCATALQTFFFGLLAELIVRTKHFDD